MARSKMKVHDQITNVLYANRNTSLSAQNVYAEILVIDPTAKWTTVRRTLDLMLADPNYKIIKIGPATYQYDTDSNVSITFFS